MEASLPTDADHIPGPVLTGEHDSGGTLGLPPRLPGPVTRTSLDERQQTTEVAGSTHAIPHPGPIQPRRPSAVAQPLDRMRPQALVIDLAVGSTANGVDEHQMARRLVGGQVGLHMI